MRSVRKRRANRIDFIQQQLLARVESRRCYAERECEDERKQTQHRADRFSPLEPGVEFPDVLQWRRPTRYPTINDSSTRRRPDEHGCERKPLKPRIDHS